MQIGDLSRTRTSREQHDSAALQAMRVLLVIGLMAGGSLALWLSAGSGARTGGMITAAPPQILAGEQQIVELPQRVERVQVADADSEASLAASGPTVEASYVPASGPRDADPAPLAAAPPPLAVEQASVSSEPAASALPTDVDMTGAVARQASLAEPVRPESPAAELVDLNRASFEQLNALKGAGALGRAIIRGRPYRSVDDLVKKKILRRTVFEKIKDQVTVQ
ncbi:ComEA family DNA-binding protein [Microvirga splendida]|uniref:Helix-hairpin-helix domain-containing protein n=1 Tax=Microvirga splendida TaxID=2795727 RepID=A0ABS0XWD1_9HYPH|nr:helix-hairpin-helix domain-containing protein [Microvirga splendida]MBJ6124362.1 helix-hairpin-helix domain-containing protein [Microvirga splendida]